MKKKIFISTQTMNIGGVERSLIGLLESIDYTNYEVDLFVYNHKGEMMKLIPKMVNQLPEIKSYAHLFEPLSVLIKNLDLTTLLVKLLANIRTKIRLAKYPYNEKNQVLNYYHTYLIYYASILLPEITNKKYNIVLAFLHPNFIEINKVKAQKYVGWIHTDYSKLVIDKKMEVKMWAKFDYIAAVSANCKDEFEKIFPEFKHKLLVIENILSADFIRKQSKLINVTDEIMTYEDELIFCTVGRFSFPKNMDNIPVIAKHLKEMQLKFKWYLIGYGGDENLIQLSISENKMTENVIILGKKENPYPYIDNCDIYIQPSRYEGKAVTVREAQILCKPVVITNFTTAQSQLIDGVDGIIVPLDNEGAAQGIINVIQNSELQVRLISNLQNRDYGNELEVNKIYNLIR